MGQCNTSPKATYIDSEGQNRAREQNQTEHYLFRFN